MRWRLLKVLEKIYWLRMVAGVAAGLLSTIYTYYSPHLIENARTNLKFTSDTFLNGLTITLAVFLFTYYLFKFMFGKEVQKPHKLFTTGVGIYFLSWIAIWSLLFTLLVEGVI